MDNKGLIYGPLFKDRREAGRRLARELEHYRDDSVVVYGMARGGMAVAAEVARYLDAPLDVLVASEIGHPLNPDYPIGAVAETGKPVWNDSILNMTSIQWREDQAAASRQEAKRLRRSYQGDQQRIAISGRTAIVVDEGIATGLGLTAALRALHHLNPLYIVVAVPVAPRKLPFEILRYCDARTYILHSVYSLWTISDYYQHFEPVTDEEVRQLLRAYPLPANERLDLAALHAVLSTMPRYPLSNGELLRQARRLNAPQSVVAFFESIPRATRFTDRKDVMLRADETELLMEEESHEPAELVKEEDM